MEYNLKFVFENHPTMEFTSAEPVEHLINRLKEGKKNNQTFSFSQNPNGPMPDPNALQINANEIKHVQITYNL